MNEETHFIPENEADIHAASQFCLCKPKLEIIDGQEVYVHNEYGEMAKYVSDLLILDKEQLN